MSAGVYQHRSGTAQNRVKAIHFVPGPFVRGQALPCGKKLSDTSLTASKIEDVKCDGCLKYQSDVEKEILKSRKEELPRSMRG